MIYAIENGQKIPLGTQFDNSWEIEYDRDLASQLVGKSEWTATEDCWFQYNGLWVRNNGNEDIDKARDLKISVNGVEVQTRDASGTSTTAITVLLFGASVLLKKGDVITFKNSLGTTFDSTSIKVFPIHRILSKDEEPVEVTLTVTHNNADLFTTTSRTPSVTLYPIGNDVYIFATPVSGISFTTVSSGGTGNTTFNVSIDGFDMLDLKMDYWQNATGVPSISGTTSANIDLDKYILVAQNIQKNGQFVFMRGQGIVRRRK